MGDLMKEHNRQAYYTNKPAYYLISEGGVLIALSFKKEELERLSVATGLRIYDDGTLKTSPLKFDGITYEREHSLLSIKKGKVNTSESFNRWVLPFISKAAFMKHADETRKEEFRLYPWKREEILNIPDNSEVRKRFGWIKEEIERIINSLTSGYRPTTNPARV